MKHLLYVMSLCLFINVYAGVKTKKVVVINHDPSAAYVVALKYQSGPMHNVKRDLLSVPKAQAILPKQTMPKPGKQITKSTVKPIKVIPTANSIDGRGELFYMGVYPEGTTRPNLFYTTNYKESLYQHPVSADKSEIVFEIYGHQAKGFDVRW